MVAIRQESGPRPGRRSAGKIGRADYGVSLDRLRVSLALARLHGTGEGLTWSAGEWARVWARLTVLQQSVVFKVCVLGLAHAEVGRRLGIARESVGSALRRAVERVRDAVPAG